MSRPEVYDYQASIVWVLDFMVINHVCVMEYEKIMSYDDAEEVILDDAQKFIKDFYDIDLSKYQFQDIHIDWEKFPELKEE